LIYLREFAPSDKKVDHPNLYPYNTLSGKFIEPLEFSEVTVLYGNNGCGKSSLLNIIALKLGIRGVQNGAVDKVGFQKKYALQTT